MLDHVQPRAKMTSVDQNWRMARLVETGLKRLRLNPIGNCQSLLQKKDEQNKKEKDRRSSAEFKHDQHKAKSEKRLKDKLHKKVDDIAADRLT